MVGSTLKRSAATLGVLAGLLAAAGPASAMAAGVGPSPSNDALQLKPGAGEVLNETVTVTAPKLSDAHRAVMYNGSGDDQMKDYLENAWPSKVEISGLMETNGDQLFLKAPTNAATQVGSEGAKAPPHAGHNLRGEAIDIIP